MARHPALTIFLKDTIRRFALIRYGANISHKWRTFSYAVLSSIPKVRLNKKVRQCGDILARKILFKVDGIKFTLVDSASIKVVLPQWEKWIWDYLKVKSGNIFLDVGAHVGKYALQVAKVVGENGLVIAIEPNRENYLALIKNITINKIENILAYNIAAWHKDCKMKLFIADKGELHSLKEKTGGLESVWVEARRLDNVIKGHRVNWIKIDVEGAEYEVLRGLENTLKEYKPKLIVEVKKKNLERIKKFMTQVNYNITPICPSDWEKEVYLYCHPQVNKT